MILFKRVKYIKFISISLFLFSFFSLVVSLWLQNTLADFKFLRALNLEQLNSKIVKAEINCSENLEDCRNKYFNIFKKNQKLGDCFAYKEKITYYLENGKIFKNHRDLFIDDQFTKLKPELSNKIISISFEKLDSQRLSCIKNSEVYKIYKIFPYYHELLFKLKNDPSTKLGASEKINPFIYGESSISNIVKRYPINYVFKSLLYISVIFMFLYWMNYNTLFKEILNTKNNKFVYFGIISAVFLFLHVTLLGMEIDNKIFKTLRKLIIVLFILSEVIAQFLLTLTLMKNKRELINYCKPVIINIKVIFISLVSLISLIVIFILLVYDLSSKVDYILEWNYFAGLLFYYFLSFLIWKKLIHNPATT
jgi:hypothetical protein